MILITSAEYIVSELQSEFGRLPPSFLPVGNKRLFEHQFETINQALPGEHIYLSLPEDFILPKKDVLKLKQKNIEVIPVPNELSLAESLLYVINYCAIYDSHLKILHGDTLILDKILPVHNSIAVSVTSDDYNWLVESRTQEEELVWCGYFSFDNPKDLARALVAAKGSFVTAVTQYATLHNMDRTIVESWLDFGHVNTYYKSRSKITTQRSFNELTIKNGRVRKESINDKKIVAEALWFKNLPAALKHFIPQLLDFSQNENERTFYELEYLCLAPLNELFVHGRNPPFFWSNIFKLFKTWFDESSSAVTNLKSNASIEQDIRGLLVEKTKTRLISFCEYREIDLDYPTKINDTNLPSLSYILEDCLSKSLKQQAIPGVLHGDLCFSNVLFDARTNGLKLLDPRGLNYNEEITCYGDLRYDLAKLTHSVIGLYDFIIADAYSFKWEKDLEFELAFDLDESLLSAQKFFLELTLLNTLKPKDSLSIVVLLFLSMLPLHGDKPDRQNALLANALRVYSLI